MESKKHKAVSETKVASNIIKAELSKRGMNYFHLQEKLADAGIVEPIENIRNKISRGTLNTIFFLQCLRALGINRLELDAEIDHDLFKKEQKQLE